MRYMRLDTRKGTQIRIGWEKLELSNYEGLLAVMSKVVRITKVVVKELERTFP